MMKALILAGGKGTRLRPLTYTMAKQLLPVANKPILFYVLEQIKECGISDIGIVISHESGPSIREALSDSSKWGAKFSFILQEKAGGLAHAVQTAQSYLDDSPFMLFLGDVLLREKVKVMAKEFSYGRSDSIILVKEVEDPRAFGVAHIDSSGTVLRVIEKPKEPVSNLALAGVYFFTPDIHRAIAQIRPSRRNELEITDAIQKLVDMGKTVKCHILKGYWLDTGTRDDLIKANRTILEEALKRDIKGNLDANSQVMGRVKISKDTSLENSIIHGPVTIAGDCRITGSYIGPYTSIGAGTIIKESSIENSVILEKCQITGIERLTDSILGQRVHVASSERTFRPVRLFAGDDSMIEL